MLCCLIHKQGTIGVRNITRYSGPMIKSFTKTVAVVVSSTILSTLAVNAIDMSGYFSRTMLGALLFGVEKDVEKECPLGMVLVEEALTPFCIDSYEVSASEECLYSNPTNEGETVLNITDGTCSPESKQGRAPWRYVTQMQAEQICSKAGKRLPTASEWYKASLGTPDTFMSWNEEMCNIAKNRDEGVARTGTGMRCISDIGAYDMIGNVWEWVAETVDRGVWDGHKLPTTGYVSGVDLFGIPYETKHSEDERFNKDKFWLDASIVSGVMKGGYYNSQNNAGIYATYIASPPSFSGEAVGFRCAVNFE